MADLGINASYFKSLQFLNEKNTTVFYIVFAIFFIFSGAFIPYLFAFGISLSLAILFNRVILNKRQPIPEKSAIIITGCSSGIGEQACVSFAESFHVFATFRKESDYNKMIDRYPAAKANITPIYVDVTKKEQIQPAMDKIEQTLEQQQLQLLALINNAGYGQTAFLEIVPEDKMKYQFDVNVFGVITMTNAVLPLLRKFRPKNTKLNPKIINVTSIMARFSLACAGLYAGSKSCLLAISDAYRQELAGQSIDVISVQPGLIKTNFHSTVETEGAKPDVNAEEFKKLTPDVQQYYLDAAQKLSDDGKSKGDAGQQPPEVVIDVFLDAILSPKPAAFYNAGADAQFLTQLFPWVAPTTLDMATSSAFKPLRDYTNAPTQVAEAKKVD